MQMGELRTAMPLTGDQRLRLEAAFAKICAEPVAFTVRLDPSLICGFRVSVGGRIYDMSYKARLEDIGEMLKGDDDGDA